MPATEKYYTPAEITQAVELYKNKKTYAEIAQVLNRTMLSVKAFIANHREKFPPRNNSGMYAKERVLHALRTQPNINAAAATLGWNAMNVDRWARLFIKTGELEEMPVGSIYRRNYFQDPDLSDLTKHLANRLWKYKHRDRYYEDGKTKHFNLHAIWIEEQLQRQNYKCYYTGAKFSMESKSNMYITIDRVDSNIGYKQDNCVLCCNIVNSAKSYMSKEKFIRMCHAVARIHPLS